MKQLIDYALDVHRIATDKGHALVWKQTHKPEGYTAKCINRYCKIAITLTEDNHDTLKWENDKELPQCKRPCLIKL